MYQTTCRERSRSPRLVASRGGLRGLPLRLLLVLSSTTFPLHAWLLLLVPMAAAAPHGSASTRRDYDTTKHATKAMEASPSSQRASREEQQQGVRPPLLIPPRRYMDTSDLYEASLSKELGFPSSESQDSMALSWLYSSTAGPVWTRNLNWMFGDPCTASWYGVHCNTIGSSNVRRIVLEDNGLAGSFPSELGFLTALADALALPTNSITGTLPSELGLITALNVGFDLYENSIVGNVPTQLGLMSGLEYVFGLEENSITGTLPTELGLMKALTGDFDLNENSFTGRCPTQFGLITGLMVHFDLDHNSLVGEVPSQLGLITGLTDYFDLYINSFSGPIPSQLTQMTRLISGFNLQQNKLTGTMPTEIGCMTALEADFLIYSNYITGGIPSQIGRLGKMQRNLYLQSNALSKTLPTQLGQLTLLTELFLQSNALAGSLPTQVGKMRPMEKLILNDNSLESALPSSICNLTGLVLFSASNNRLSGRLPACMVFPDMEVFNVASNSFHGILPSVLGWAQLSYLLLHSNNFHGSLKTLGLNGSTLSSGTNPYPFETYYTSYGEEQTQFYFGGNILGLTLHDNALDEELPEDLVLPESLEIFTINNNDIPGTVHQGLLANLNSSANLTLVLSNNRLSCDLSSAWDFALSPNSVILIGNQFSQPIPHWVSPSERKSTFLSTTTVPQWSTFELPEWLVILFYFLPTLAISIVSLGYLRRVSTAAPTLLTTRERGPVEQEPNESPHFILHCSKAAMGFALAFMPLLLLVYGLASTKSSGYFQCGDAFVKFTTIGNIADAPGLEGLAAALVCLYTLASGALLLNFVPVPPLGPLLQPHPGVTPAKHLLEPMLAHEDARSDEHEGKHQEGMAEPLKEAAGSPKVRMTTRLCVAALMVIWVSTLLLLGGVPTVLYVLTYQLPEDNTLKDIFPLWLLSSLSTLLALYLTLLSKLIIPGLTDFTVDRILSTLGQREREREQHQHMLRTVLALVARTVLVIIVPCVTVIVFSDGCYRGWTQLWKMCNNPGSFQETLYIPFYLYAYASGNGDGYENVYGHIPVPLIDHGSICPTSWFSDFQNGTCGRSIVSLLGPLLLKKLILAVLFSALEPVVVAATLHLKARCASRRRKEDSDVSLPEVEGMVGPSWPPRDGDSNDGASLTASDEAEETFRDQAGAQESSDWVVTAREPDPQRRLIWFETALVFGSLIPLLLPLLALQLFMDAHILEWRLRKAPSAFGEAKQLPVQQRTMQCHVMVVLVLQSALTMFFFVDSQLRGWQVVVVVLPLICVCMLVGQVRDVRFGDLWLLVCHQRRGEPDWMGQEAGQQEETRPEDYAELRASELVQPLSPGS